MHMHIQYIIILLLKYIAMHDIIIKANVISFTIIILIIFDDDGNDHLSMILMAN